MAAIQRTRTSSFAAGAFVIAVSAALLAGASGGYLVRALTSHVTAPSSAVQNLPRADTSQGGPRSDLTRVLPTEAVQRPAWVQGYVSPSRSRAFRVDELIDRLDSAQTGTAAQVPATALQYTP
jgi:hypothetical protein